MQLHVWLWHICTLSVRKVKKSAVIFNKREMNVCGENGSIAAGDKRVLLFGVPAGRFLSPKLFIC